MSGGGKASYKSATLEQGSRDATDPLIHIEPDCTSQFASPFELLRLFVTVNTMTVLVTHDRQYAFLCLYILDFFRHLRIICFIIIFIDSNDEKTSVLIRFYINLY